MPAYPFSTYAWWSLAFQIAFALLVALATLPLIASSRDPRVLRDGFTVAFAMSLLGMVTGFLTGISRAPAIGAVLPAVLSLIAGLLLFMIGRESDPAKQRLVASCVTALIVNLLIGTLWGSVSRESMRSLTVTTENQETLREVICDERLAYEIATRNKRVDGNLPDANPGLLVPGCTPPFERDTETKQPSSSD
jgi:ABC-type uncharacterized transport system permease subunit